MVMAACGGAPTAEPTSVATSVVVTTSLVTTTAPAGTATTVGPAPTTTPRIRPEGDDAPHFSLVLGEGGVFTLTEETRPVFLLFWAEW